MTTATSTQGYRSTTTTPSAAASDGAPRKRSGPIWTGRVMSGLVVAFLLLACALPKLFMPQVAAPAMHELGWNEKHLSLLAAFEIIGAILYAIPRTAALVQYS